MKPSSHNNTEKQKRIDYWLAILSPDMVRESTPEAFRDDVMATIKRISWQPLSDCLIKRLILYNNVYHIASGDDAENFLGIFDKYAPLPFTKAEKTVLTTKISNKITNIFYLLKKQKLIAPGEGPGGQFVKCHEFAEAWKMKMLGCKGELPGLEQLSTMSGSSGSDRPFKRQRTSGGIILEEVARTRVPTPPCRPSPEESPVALHQSALQAPMSPIHSECRGNAEVSAPVQTQRVKSPEGVSVPVVNGANGKGPPQGETYQCTFDSTIGLSPDTGLLITSLRKDVDRVFDVVERIVRKLSSLSAKVDSACAEVNSKMSQASFEIKFDTISREISTLKNTPTPRPVEGNAIGFTIGEIDKMTEIIEGINRRVAGLDILEARLRDISYRVGALEVLSKRHVQDIRSRSPSLVRPVFSYSQYSQSTGVCPQTSLATGELPSRDAGLAGYPSPFCSQPTRPQAWQHQILND